jgi:hypothetical protein
MVGERIGGMGWDGWDRKRCDRRDLNWPLPRLVALVFLQCYTCYYTFLTILEKL